MPINLGEENVLIDSVPGHILIKSRNQLIRQMRSMKMKYPGYRRIQIYLTTDKVYPREVLFRVRNQANAEGLSDTELYWLSWHDLPQAIEKGRKDLSERDKIVAADLLMLFERKGFARFSKVDPPFLKVFNYFRFVARTPYLQINLPFIAKKLSLAPKLTPSQMYIDLTTTPKTKLTVYEEVSDGN